MIRMINVYSGSTMWVHDSRLDEYLKMGHKLAVPPEPAKPTEPVKRPAKKKKAE